jgi:hypothetical protein
MYYISSLEKRKHGIHITPGQYKTFTLPMSWVLTHISLVEPRAMHTFYYHNTISRLSSGLRDAEGQEVEMRHRHGYANEGTSSIDCPPS